MTELQPIEVEQMGAMIIFRYPYRKTKELILYPKGYQAHCLICDEDVPNTKPHTAQKLVAASIQRHIMSHDRRKAMREAARG